MIRLPQRYTLLPYPTLFRSGGDPRDRGAAPQADPRVAGRAGALAQPLGRRRRPPGREGVGPVDGRPPDRKSTRLNSSHANISYAVFCLKIKHSLTKFIDNIL